MASTSEVNLLESIQNCHNSSFLKICTYYLCANGICLLPPPTLKQKKRNICPAAKLLNNLAIFFTLKFSGNLMTESLLKNKNPPPCILPQEGWPKLPAHLLCPLLLLHLDISQSYNVQYAATKKERQCYGNVWGMVTQLLYNPKRPVPPSQAKTLRWHSSVVSGYSVKIFNREKQNFQSSHSQTLFGYYPSCLRDWGGGEGRLIALSSRHPGCSTSTSNFFFSEKVVFHLIILR